ncbi:hypothetical protein, partial [Peribacillus simplex]|uniref:hypothetical protein n=1 Tax=Peribacillus simplex TaxID=1478 RepID=UPI001C87229A
GKSFSMKHIKEELDHFLDFLKEVEEMTGKNLFPKSHKSTVPFPIYCVICTHPPMNGFVFPRKFSLYLVNNNPSNR